MVRFGILGFGHHAALRLVPSFAVSSKCTLNGLWRRNAEKAQQDASTYKIPHNFSSPAELCASSEIDAVFVTSPDALHMEHVLLALKHGKPVLCEKPLGMNVAEVQAMNAAAKQAGLLFGAAQNFRFNRSLSVAQQWIKEGRIGKPRLAHFQFCYQGKDSPREWIYDPGLACGGPIGDVGIHCIDAMRFLLQDEVKAVSTLAGKDALSGDVESSAVLALELVSGAFATISVTTRADYRSLFEVVGEHGTILCEDGLAVEQPVELILRQAGRVALSETVSNADGYTRMLDCFANAMAGESEYLATGVDGLINQKVLDAAYASWRNGTWQSVT